MADVEVASEVAGSLGFGTYLKGQWFAGPLTPSQQPQSIAYKELFPVVVAANSGVHSGASKHVFFRSDNDCVVHILNSRTSKVPCLMRLLCNLLLSAASHSFSFSAQHVPGVNNRVADRCLAFVGRNSGI